MRLRTTVCALLLLSIAFSSSSWSVEYPNTWMPGACIQSANLWCVEDDGDASDAPPNLQEKFIGSYVLNNGVFTGTITMRGFVTVAPTAPRSYNVKVHYDGNVIDSKSFTANGNHNEPLFTGTNNSLVITDSTIDLTDGIYNMTRCILIEVKCDNGCEASFYVYVCFNPDAIVRSVDVGVAPDPLNWVKGAVWDSYCEYSTNEWHGAPTCNFTSTFVNVTGNWACNYDPDDSTLANNLSRGTVENEFLNVNPAPIDPNEPMELTVSVIANDEFGEAADTDTFQ